MHVAVIGAGGWGTALAALLASIGHHACVWVRRPALFEELQVTRENHRYLPGVTLPASLAYANSLAEAVRGATLIVLSIPSHAIRAIVRQLSPVLSGTPLVVSTTKGIEEETLKTATSILQDELPSVLHPCLAVLSGPSFAADVARGLPTAVTVAAEQEKIATTVQQVFSSPKFRVYTTTDVVGVEVGGAVKNVIAIAAGVSDGLGYGHSARAALITRGLAEITRLAVRMGATPQTLSGLAGMGDLVLTCTSTLSRNYTIGLRFGRGEQISDILAGMTTVAEGVRTCRSVFSLAQRLGVEMPIVEQVCALLYGNKPAQQVVTDLLTRETKPEFS
ncbi:MAG: NAD(P)-dependent glycerol-3-phosphate dehydrogenase [Deltaproteobacteria bacterium]|nr:NAD(P)-dependent glycerol-3-phosphate dehydrogenase [Deltaproteobacteria bacterium]